MLHRTIHFALVLLLLDSLTLVKFLLTTAEGYIHLCTTFVVDEYEGRDDGESHSLGVFLQAAYLTLVEQQFTVTLRLVVVVRAVEIWVNIHALDPYLAIVDVAECVNEGSLTKSDGLDLCAGQYYAGCVCVNEEIVERCLLVFYLHRTLLAKFLLYLIHI